MSDQPQSQYRLPTNYGPRRTPSPEEEKAGLKRWTEYNRKIREAYEKGRTPKLDVPQVDRDWDKMMDHGKADPGSGADIV